MARPPLAVLRMCAVGFDTRALSLLQTFIRTNCRDVAELVEEETADVALVDIDSFTAREALDTFRLRYPDHKLVIMTLANAPAPQPNAFIVKKPVRVPELLAVLEQVRAMPSPAPPQAVTEGPVPTQLAAVAEAPPPIAVPPEQPVPAVPPTTENFGVSWEPMVSVEPAKVRTNQAAKLLSAGGNDEEVVYHAPIRAGGSAGDKTGRYDPRKYLQGYLESACQLAINKNCALRLNTGWKPIVIFPHSREILIEANDNQLRSFCLVPVHSIPSMVPGGEDMKIMTIALAGAGQLAARRKTPFDAQRMEAFLWKVALWTSAGRVPEEVDLERAVYLRHWPNFTRLQMFPNSLRIAALLAHQPRSLLDVAETLEIPQKDVFAFYSAARAIGLAGQVKNQLEAMAEPPTIEANKNSGLLKKILKRLFTATPAQQNG